MEMGTGKTRTALELIKLRLDKGKVNHVLWLCPCSVKENLKRDILKHCEGDLGMFTICGIETLSSSIRAMSILLKLVEEKNCYLIVDESNLVKNPQAKRTQNIIRLAEKCKYKLILNGTPISRTEADLYAQWYILDWRILGYQSFWSFAANHLEYDENIPGRIVRALNVDVLMNKIGPYSYQVRKAECLDLPEKTYDTAYYYMDIKQDEIYDRVAEELMFSVDEMKPETIYRLFTGLQNVISGLNVITTGEHLQTKPLFDNLIDNPRIKRLLELLEGITEKVIIFCKYTHEIESICSVLGDKAVPFYGKLSRKKRNKNIESFSKDKQILVANKVCAGYGLNLQFCSYVIYYSNDWDYATRVQSEDRVHRIGQNENVHIVDICAKGTLDGRILDCLENKENLVDSFKRELKEVKDKDEYLQYVIKHNWKGKKYKKHIKAFDKSDLEEVD